MRALSPGAKVHSEEGQKHSEPEDLTTVVGGAHSGDRLRNELDAELKAKFDEYGLGPRCEEICAQLEVTCVSDLVYVDPEDVEELKLKPVPKKKLLELICSVGSSGADGGGGGGGSEHEGQPGKVEAAEQHLEPVQMDSELLLLFSSKGLKREVCARVCSKFGVSRVSDLFQPLEPRVARRSYVHSADEGAEQSEV